MQTQKDGWMGRYIERNRKTDRNRDGDRDGDGDGDDREKEGERQLVNREMRILHKHSAGGVWNMFRG